MSSQSVEFRTFNKTDFKAFFTNFATPILGVLVFLMLWSVLAPKVVTSLGAVPGPKQVYSQFQALVVEHKEERQKQVAFYERQDTRNAKKLAEDPNATIKVRKYAGNPTFFDQIITSIVTVMAGFILASLIAIPIGIVAGLSKTVYAALNPLVQIFKPVSPLAWLPIVTMIVSATYVTSDDAWFDKSF